MAPGARANQARQRRTKSQVAALVQASLKIKSLPSNLTPSLEEAVNDPTSPTVDGANDI